MKYIFIFVGCAFLSGTDPGWHTVGGTFFISIGMFLNDYDLRGL